MRKLRGTFSLWWVSHQHHAKVQLWPAPCHPSQDMLPSHLPCLSLIPRLDQQPVPSQSPCAGQSLPHSPLPCLHSGPGPSLPSWASQPKWLCVSLSVPSSTPKDLTKPKAACWTLYKGSLWLFKESLSSKALHTRPWLGLLPAASPGRLPAGWHA